MGVGGVYTAVGGADSDVGTAENPAARANASEVVLTAAASEIRRTVRRRKTVPDIALTFRSVLNWLPQRRNGFWRAVAGRLPPGVRGQDRQ
jgi:hypothetical protein